MSVCPFDNACLGGPPCRARTAVALADIAAWELDPAHRNRLCANDTGNGAGAIPHRRPMHAVSRKGAEIARAGRRDHPPEAWAKAASTPTPMI